MPDQKVHANLQTNDNWTISLPFLSNSSHDICWNLATVKILIFSGAHHRSTTILRSIVCHRLKNDPWEISPSREKAREIREKSKNQSKNQIPQFSLPPRNSRAFRNRRIPFSNTSLSVFIERALETSLDRENRTEITGNSLFGLLRILRLRVVVVATSTRALLHTSDKTYAALERENNRVCVSREERVCKRELENSSARYWFHVVRVSFSLSLSFFSFIYFPRTMDKGVRDAEKGGVK